MFKNTKAYAFLRFHDGTQEKTSEQTILPWELKKNQLLTRLLHPLPILYIPWSYITVDFITGLSVSKSFIEIIIDYFYMAWWLVPPQNLPIVMEIAEVILLKIFNMMESQRMSWNTSLWSRKPTKGVYEQWIDGTNASYIRVKPRSNTCDWKRIYSFKLF